MLIQALCEYYDVLEKAGKVMPEGYSKARIHYLIHLTPDGKIEKITDCKQVPEGNGKAVPIEEMMPERLEKTAIQANIVEHRPVYLFGLNYEDGVFTPYDKTKKAEKSHRALVESNLKFLEGLDSPVINAYRKFLENWNPEAETENPQLLELGKSYSKSNYMFCLSGRPDLLLHHDPELKMKWESRVTEEEGTVAQCAVTGEEATIARIHGKIKGIVGGQATGNVLVAFNNSSECSYGMEQSYNSNVSEAAMKKYTEALNYLLSSDKHKVLIDDMTIVFWTVDAEEKNELQLRKMLFGIGQGEDLEDQAEVDPNVEFYMLGLKPNVTRIAVQFFCRRRFADILCNVKNFQTDMQVSERANAVSIYQIRLELFSPNCNEKKTSLNPSILVGLLEASLCNTKYPYTLLDTVVKRIKTDVGNEKKWFGEVRAGILKACINRNYITKKEECITVELNTENQNQAYLCGRLFAILEKLQEEALGSLNRTIKDSYFSSAASTPMLVFPRLLRLSQSHLKKVKRSAYYNNLIGEIMGEIKGQFPHRFSIPEQGMFELGYYQQRQSMYSKKNKNKEEN